MAFKILIAHALGEEDTAEKIAVPLRKAGFEVWDHHEVLVGESITEEASKILATGASVVLCGTVRAVGTKWGRRVVNAARQYPGVKVFILQMDADADVDTLSFGDKIGRYWEDPTKSMDDLVLALQKYSRSPDLEDTDGFALDVERRYAEISLKSCDIIDLASLPETDRFRATQQLELRRLYVSLRVQIEVSSEDKPSVTKSDREILKRGRKKWSDLNENLTGFRHDRIPLGERLVNSRCLVILGDPGSGKTTLLRWISTAYLLRLKHDSDWSDLPDVSSLPSEDWLPILSRCRDFPDNQPPNSLEELLHHSLRRAEISDHEASVLVPLLIKRLEESKGLLLIDGVDEIADVKLRVNFCRQIEQIHLAHPMAPIVVTSRSVGYREMGQPIGRGFEHLTVAELSREDKDEFAKLWCALTEVPERRDEATAELIQDIHSTDRIERLTSNPMLLTTLALVKRKVGRLPRHRVDLYGDALAVLLNWRREVDKPVDWYEAVPQLEYIAYSMCDRGVLQIRKDQILEVLRDLRMEYPALYAVQAHIPEQFLELLERDTGIIVQVGSIRHLGLLTPVYEFRHLTFQEYLAARSLIDGCYPGRDRSKSIAEVVAPLAGRLAEGNDESDEKEKEVAVSENWLETLRLCVGACRNDDVDRVLLAIVRPLASEDSHVTQRPRAILAGLCLADDPNVSKDVAREILIELVRQIDHREEKEEERSDVSATIQELSTSRWVDTLKSILLNAFCEIVSLHRISVGRLYGVVATSLMALKDDSVRGEWFQSQIALILSGKEHERIDAALTIGAATLKYQIQPSKILVEALLAHLTDTEPSALSAALTLSALNHERQKESEWRPSLSEQTFLIRLVESEKTARDVIVQLFSILGREGDISASQAILSRVNTEDLQIAAIAALAKTGARTPTQLIALLKDANVDLKLSIIRALEKIKGPDVFEPLVAELTDSDSKIRSAAAKALGNLGEKRAASRLLTVLNDSDENVRIGALEALHQLGNKEHMEVHVLKLEDESGEVRAAAASLLIRTKHPQAVDVLLPKLADRDNKARAGIATALGESGDPRVIEPLITMLSDESDQVFIAAALSLGRLKDRRAVAPLIVGLNSIQFLRRFAASFALMLIGDEEAIDPLLAKLTENRGWTTGVFIWQLATFKNPRVVPALVSMLKTAEEGVKAELIQTLGRLRDPRAVAPLYERIGDQDSQIRASATLALSNFEDERVQPMLLNALQDEAFPVRVAAVRGLGRLKDPNVFDVVMGSLTDYASSIRKASVRALAEIGDNRAVLPLLSRLEHESNHVKVAIIQALRGLKDVRSVEALLKELTDPNSEIQSAAHDALYSIALSLFSEENIPETIRIFSSMVSVESNDNNLHNNLAFCFLLQGNYDSAKAQLSVLDYEVVTENRPLYQNNLALVTFLTGDPSLAKKQLWTALRWIEELGPSYDPNSVSAVLMLNSPSTVASHVDVPVDVAVLTNLYLMDGLTATEVHQELRNKYPAEHVRWEDILRALSSRYYSSHLSH